MPLTFSYLPLQKQRQLWGKCALWIVWLLELYQEDHRTFPLLTSQAPCPLLLLFWLLLLHFNACCKKCLHLVCGIDGKWLGYGLGGARGLWLLCKLSSQICVGITWEREGGEGGRVVRRWLLLFPLSSCCPCVPQLSSSCTKHSSCPITPAQNTPPALSPLHLLSHSLL